MPQDKEKAWSTTISMPATLAHDLTKEAEVEGMDFSAYITAILQGTRKRRRSGA